MSRIKGSFLLFLAGFLSGVFFIYLTGVQAADSLVYSDSEVPVILPRATWDSTPQLNALLNWLPQNTISPSDWQPVERIVVHDTATPNNDPLSPIARIQSIYRFHAVTNKWDDVGYNYFIDRSGKIYEGRYGGNGVRGAHAFNNKTQQNFNYGSVGISLIGSYSKETPPKAAQESLARLIGWLAAVNNFDPAQTEKSFAIWTPATNSFSSSFSGAVVAGHKDIDNKKIDPGKLDLAKIRQLAAEYKRKYQGAVYKAAGGPKIYEIKNGSRKVFATMADYVAQVANVSTDAGGDIKTAVISQSQLNLFSDSRFLKYPDGSLLSSDSSPIVYLIDEGKKRNLKITPAQLAKLGFDWDRIKKIDQTALDSYPVGADILYGADKSILTDGVKIYLISNGKKRLFTSLNLFEKLGYKLNDVKKTESAQLEKYLDGEILSYPNGALVRASNSPSVYLAQNGKLKLIINEEVFKNLKFDWSRVLTVDAAELVYYPQDTLASFADKTLIRPENENNVYLIAAGKPQLIDAKTFKAKKYNWAQVLKVAAEDFAALYRGAKPVASVSLTVSSGTGSIGEGNGIAPVSSSTAIAAVATSTKESVAAIPATESKVRVMIYEAGVKPVELTASTAFDVLDKNGQVVAAKNAGEKFNYSMPQDLTKTFARVVPRDPQGVIEILSYEDRPAWKPTLNYNKFRGAIEVIYSAKSKKSFVVNELLLEDYLRGIAETAQGEPQEYQKTMAVASRTYAYNYAQKGGKYGVDEVYYLKKTTDDQLYKGYAREILTSDLVKAVEATRGEIIMFGGAPIVAAYSSGAAQLQKTGTRPACLVWGQKFCGDDYKYLAGGAKDPAGTKYSYDSCSAGNHCVGLSGAGTRQFAKSGAKNYQEILKYYYPGTEIKKVY